MKRELILAAVLAMGVGIAQAQTGGTPNTNGTPSQSGANNPANTPGTEDAGHGRARDQAPATMGDTQGSGSLGGSNVAAGATQSAVKGCLGGSAGNWMLTTDDGKTVKLVFTDNSMSQYSGNEVRIDGTAAPDGSLQVQTVKRVADSCTPAAREKH